MAGDRSGRQGSRLMPAFMLPDLGEGLTEAEIVAWHVKVGDTVVIDQKVVEVETAKTTVEIPVPFAGLVTELHAELCEVVAVGQPLVTVEGADDSLRDLRPSFAPEPHMSMPRAGTDDPGVSGSVLVGFGTPADGGRRLVKPSEQSARRVLPADFSSTTPPLAAGPVPVASPLVRKLARDAGIDLAVVRGSGDGGLITRKDVDAAIKARIALAATEVTRIPLRGQRKAAADKFTRSRREIPEATVWVDVDATELVKLRAVLNAGTSAPISLLALVTRFAILGLRRYPELNARIESDEIVLSQQVHLGFAAQTDYGLVVPVLHEAERFTLERLSEELSERTERARSGGLTPSDMAGGTFTVNNYGVFGVDGSAAIINHPEVAILGVGRVIERPWVVDGAVVPRHICELTLAFDHRACDGGTVSGFLRFVADCIETPAIVLRHL
jgi:2-oxoisovalerate dehydrogenase E2 component (dihydrolipoyl transacylase)